MLKDMTKKNFTSIIILCWNQIEYTKLCIASIRTFTKNNYELICVDNGSTDGTFEWLNKQKDIKLIKNEQNLGFPIGCNQGIDEATGDTILFLNNDTIVTKIWLDNLLTALNSSEQIGAVGPVTNRAGNFTSIPTPYNNDLVEMQKFAETYNVSNPKKWEERLRLIGYCLLVKRKALEDSGTYFDEKFTPGLFEDDDLSLRMVDKGYKLLLCKDTFIHHFSHASFNEVTYDTSIIFNKNLKYLENKWGISINGLQIDPSILPELKTYEITKDNQLLVIGTGCSATSLVIKYLFPEINIVGFEQNANMAKFSDKFIPTISGDYDDLPNCFKNKTFDYIILLADISPDIFHNIFSSIKSLLTENGKLILNKTNENKGISRS